MKEYDRPFNGKVRVSVKAVDYDECLEVSNMEIKKAS